MRNKKPAQFSLKRESRALKFKHRRKDDWINDLYRGAEWRKYRNEFLKLHPKCCECDQKASVVDHIKSVKRGKTVAEQMRLFWDHENHQAMCYHHHNSKTARIDGGFGRARANSLD